MFLKLTEESTGIPQLLNKDNIVRVAKRGNNALIYTTSPRPERLLVRESIVELAEALGFGEDVLAELILEEK